MSNIGITQPGLLSVPALPIPAQAAPAVSQAAGTGGAGVAEPASFDVQAAEQRRVDAIQKTAQQIANVFVLGDQSFSLFKDATGQYITRFTSLRDGKVTYIPEPTLFKLGSSGSEPSVSINV